MLPRALVAIPLLVSLSCAEPPAAASPPPPARRPGLHPVVVTLVVDQLAAWIAAERLRELPMDGGFARLRREGTWVTALRYEHAVTDTAPGHAALYTGTVPAVSGIFANEVLDDEGKPASILRDPKTHVLGEDGVEERPGSSLSRLRVETVADRLRAEHPDAVIVSLSLKDRASLPGGGRHPSASLWLDLHDNRFVTSTAVAQSLPSWAGPPLTLALRRAEASTWELLDRAWVETHSATPDAEAGEGDLPGFGTVFPHHLGKAARPELAFRTSPFADELLLDLGLTALDAENAAAHETLLAVSLSANDYIGHTFGPDSWEAWDELERLDRTLERFFRALDTRYGPDGYAVLLAADHGTTPMPETGRHAYCDGAIPDAFARACGPVYRVLPDVLSRKLEARAREVLGPGQWVLGISDPYVDLTATARALTAERRAALYGALEETLLAYPGVAKVYDVSALPSVCPEVTDESMDALVCRSVVRGGSPPEGELYVALAPGSFFDPNIVLGKGTSHGSPYPYDRTVPLLARAPLRVRAGVALESTTFDAFADTATALLGVAPLQHAGKNDSLLEPPPGTPRR